MHASSIHVDLTSHCATITLDRPEVHNALNDEMISELLWALQTCEVDPDIRMLCLNAEGEHFSAGADLQWMKAQRDAAHQENLEDAKQFAHLMQRLNQWSKPTCAHLHGAVIGGAVGLIACCDMVVATPTTYFRLPEVRLGLVPAVIAPYVTLAMGGRLARRYFLTGERFDVTVAQQFGLVSEVTKTPETQIEQWQKNILKGGPKAITTCKQLLRRMEDVSLRSEGHRQKEEGAHDFRTSDLIDETIELIATLRVSDEGQEGLKAFLEKRNPHWCSEHV